MSAIAAMAGAVAAYVRPFEAVCSPSSVSGYGDLETGIGDTNYTVPILTGSVEPISFLWEHVSGSTFTILPAPTNYTVGFRGYYGTAVYKVTCTDGAGHVAVAYVNVSIV